MNALFAPIRFREIELRNRIVVSPMCEYSAVDGHPQPWHMVHLGSRAVGGAALVIAEATSVEERGRISLADTGIYLDSHVDSWKPIAGFIREQGAVAGIQLAHAGRKASTDLPWLGGKPLASNAGAWRTVSSSAVPFDQGYSTPKELSVEEIKGIVHAFALSARRALAAGFQVVEIHSAHGYLLHQFLSPLVNQRRDEFGGSFENRIRFPLAVVKAVRETWPANLSVFLRLSATDWVEGGWDLEQSIEFARKAKALGVDLVDCSSGGTVPAAKVPVGPGFQVPFAEAIRTKAEIATGAVGLITGARQAEEIVATGKADVVLMAREFLRDPYWPRKAAQELGGKIKPPVQYERAW